VERELHNEELRHSIRMDIGQVGWNHVTELV
jgi:hypothetical protein